MLALGLFVLLCGPTLYMFSLGVESLGVYLDTFFSRSLSTGAASGDTWPHSWTVFYWSVWFAWAPVSALFLGKIGRGYTSAYRPSAARRVASSRRPVRVMPMPASR